MRRHLALGLVVALLIVSGAPLVSAAKLCVMDTPGQTMLEQTGHTASSDAMQDAQHSSALDLAADTCRIECACGCHSSMDPLPNLLAPHAPCVQSSMLISTEDVALALPFLSLTPLTSVVPSPPPRNV